MIIGVSRIATAIDTFLVTLLGLRRIVHYMIANYKYLVPYRSTMLLYIKIFPAAFITATKVCKVTSKSNLGKAAVYFSIVGLISAGLFLPPEISAIAI